MKNLITECIDIITDLAGHDYLYFDNAVEIKTSPHNYPFQAWGTCVSPGGQLFIMDSNEQWHPLELDDRNATLVIGSLYQRLSLMRVKYARAS